MGWGIGENSVLYGWLRFHVKHALPAQPNGRFEAGSNCILADHFCLGGAGDFTSTIMYSRLRGRYMLGPAWESCRMRKSVRMQ